jgi:hypothetical protein
MPRCAALLAVALVACASTGTSSTSSGSPGVAQSVTVQGATGVGSVRVSTSNDAHVTSVPFPVPDVWRALLAAYDSLGIPITSVNEKTHVVANEGFKLRQRLGKTSLSRYLDCGATQIGANADSYDVHFAITSRVVEGAPGAASISTTVEAAAKPITFAQDYSRCITRGTLETRLVDLVKAQLRL